MSTARFNRHINQGSLRFKDPAIESSFRKQKDEDFSGMWPRGIVMLMMGIWTVNILTRIVYNVTQGPESYLGAGLAALLTGLMGIALEFLVHVVSSCQYIRGLCLSVGATMAGIVYGAYLQTTPLLLPGSNVLIILAIICNLYFAYDWRFAIINQIVGHTAMTTLVVVRFAPSLSDIEVFSPLVSLNALLLFLPFFFYFAERDKRLIAFHASLCFNYSALFNIIL